MKELRTNPGFWGIFWRFQVYFEDNPRDLQALRHDRPLHPANVQPHLGHVPEYLGTQNGLKTGEIGRKMNKNGVKMGKK